MNTNADQPGDQSPGTPRPSPSSRPTDGDDRPSPPPSPPSSSAAGAAGPAGAEREQLPDGSPSPFPRTPGIPRTRPDVVPPRGPFPDTLPGIGPVVGATRPDAIRSPRNFQPPPGAFGPPIARPAAPPAKPKPSTRARWTRRGLLVVLALVALYAFRGIWLGPLLARHFETRLSDALGADITIRVVEGNGIDTLRLVGVSTRRDGTLTPVRRLAARTIRLRYNLQDWINGRDDWLQTIEVDGLELDIDLSHGGVGDSRRLDNLHLPVTLPEVHVLDGTVRLHMNGDSGTGGKEAGSELRLARLAIDHFPAGPARSRMDLLAQDISGRIGTRVLPPGSLRIEAVRVGSSVQINRLEHNNAALTRSMRLTLDEDAGSVQLTGDLTLADGSAFADVTLREIEATPGRWQPVFDIARLHIDSVDQSSLVELPGFAAWPLPVGRLSGEVDGRVWWRSPERTALSLRLSMAGGRLDGDALGLLGGLPAALRPWIPREVSPESATINVDMHDGRFDVHDVSMVTAGARWTINGLGFAPAADFGVARDGMIATVDPRGARLELRAPDLGPLARAFGPSRIPFNELAGLQLDVAARIDPGGLALSVRVRDADGHEVTLRGVLDPHSHSARPDTSAAAKADGGTARVPIDVWFAQLSSGDAQLAGNVRLADLNRVRRVATAMGADAGALDSLDGTLTGTFEVSHSLDEPAMRLSFSGDRWRRGPDLLGSFAVEARVLRMPPDDPDTPGPSGQPGTSGTVGVFLLDRLDALGTPDLRAVDRTERDPLIDRVRASGRLRFSPWRIEDAYLEAVLNDLSRYDWLARLLVPDSTPALAGRVSASIVGSGPPDAWTGDVQLSARHLQAFGWSADDVTLDGLAGPDKLRIYHAETRSPRGRVSLAGTIDWSGIRTVGATDTAGQWLDVSLRAFSLARYADRVTLDAPTTLRLHLELPDSGGDSLQLVGVTIGGDLRLSGTAGNLSARGRLRLSGGDSDFSCSLRGARMPVIRRLLAPASALPIVGLDEPIDRIDLIVGGQPSSALWELRVGTGQLPLDSLPWVADVQTFGTPDDATADRARSQPRIDITLWITGNGPDARLRDLRGRLFAVDDNGSSALLATATAAGTMPLDPMSVLRSWSGYAAVESVTSVDRPAGVDRLPALPTHWLDRLLAPGALSLRLQLDVDDVAQTARINPLLPLPAGRFTIDCGVSGSWRQPGVVLIANSPRLDFSQLDDAQLRALDGDLGTHFADVAAQFITLEQPTLDVRLTFGPRVATPGEPRAPGTLGELRLERLLLDTGPRGGRIEFAGALHTRGSVVGALAGREPIDLIDARLTTRASIPSLALWPLPFGRQPAVDAALEVDLQAGSLLHHPRWSGFIEVRNGRFDGGGSTPPFDAINARIEFGGDVMTVANATLQAGSGPITLSGRAHLAPDPERVRMAFRAVGTNVLLARDDGVNLRADLDLTLDGSFEKPVLHGVVTTTRGRIERPLEMLDLLQSTARPPDALPSVLVPWLGDPQLDVRIESRQPVQVHTAATDAEVTAGMRLLGTARQPRLDGRLDIAKMYVTLPATTVHIDAGGVVFRESAPGQPEIWLRGRSSVRGYRIDLEFSGAAGQPSMQLSSVPPLPADQLLVMLFTGDAPRAVDTLKGADLAGAEKVSVFIGPDVLRRVFGPDPQVREQVLDRIDVQPDVDLSESGESMFVVRFALAQNIFTPADRVEVEFARDRYDDFNTGLTFTLRFR